MPEKGLFIAIEGGDGSGKATQAELLNKRCIELGKLVLKVSFPRYEEDSSYYATQYLNGHYGQVNDVHPDLASLTYAIDRFAEAKNISEHLEKGGVVIADRYVASNLAHQGTKFDTKQDRLAFYERTMRLEYGILGIPRPDKNIVLLVPAKTAQNNVDKKETRSYTTAKRDIHEADASHLERAKSNYEELCELYPDEFIDINCVNSDSSMRSIDAIHSDIIKLVDL